jgi:diguanylate cyclase (GGDEF)-like protein
MSRRAGRPGGRKHLPQLPQVGRFPDDDMVMRSKLFTGYVAIMGVAVGAFVFAPDTEWVRVTWEVGVGVLAALFTIIGTRGVAGRSAWLLVAAGVFLNSSGILVEAIVYRLNPDAESPTAADGFWLALYPCLVAGMVIIHRCRSRTKDWSTTLDTATITTGLGLLSWVFVIRPSTHDAVLTLAGHAVVAAYPVGDVVVLAMMTRLLLSGSGRLPALRYLIGAVFTLLLGDTLWLVWSQLEIDVTGVALNVMNMIFLAAFAAIGAGALHPSVRQVAQPTETPQRRVGPGLLMALTLAALIAPAVQIGQALTGQIVDGVAIALSSTVLFLLVVTRLAGLLRHIDAQSRQLRELATVDALTGLPNRRAWSAELPSALERARRDQRLLSVVMLDLDHFKWFNDEFGHPAGDRLLKGAAAAWREKIRTVDLLARYGGEEFIVLLPNADVDEAIQLTERLRSATPLGQTFSAGVASWDGVETSDDLVNRADQALYRSKRDGRNRTTAAEPVTVQPDAQVTSS